MFAQRMRQKESEFYFVSYPAEDLLRKVRFVSRFYGERGEVIGGDTSDAKKLDDVERYVQAIEKNSKSFQRDLNRRKVRQIKDFYRNETRQPVIPGAVLLFSTEKLEFQPMKGMERAGNLAEPRGDFLIIDGQHRLAGLHFYLQEKDADRRVEVPVVIFDGKTSDFATEMFVVINSTHTRINKSHLIDLYERIEWGTDPEKKYAATLVRALYEEDDSPLQYHINMLGGRSHQEMWLNQAQLFGEVLRLIKRKDATHRFKDGRGWSKERGYGLVRDVLRACRSGFGDAWGDNKGYMVTRDVTLEAMVRLAGDVAAKTDAAVMPGADLQKVLDARFKALGELVFDFRRDGFYERFPARGQVERIDIIKKRLARQTRFEG
ncbi:MAG: DGQHR domain-containing protein [Planctomycetes bacterium]|nr:DGQHR domain-containing protein [Planctomycetota bacterium]